MEKATQLTQHRYIIISPVKDEDKYIEQTLRSVAEQTVQPLLWVIVDDGSRDRTLEIAEQYEGRFRWIRIHKISRDHARKPGSAVVHAFNTGLQFIDGIAFDFIVKLDGDLNLPPDYFERLFAKFDADNTLGIASGVFLEREGDTWTVISMPAYHTAGASKVVRASCFAQIGGFVASRGWDTVDEIRAQIHGWKTAHFTDIKFQHLKREGSGIGAIRTNVMYGEIYYLTGGGAFFLFLKILHRAWTRRPIVLAALAIVWGYIRFCRLRPQRLVTEEEARHYRTILNHRITAAFSHAVWRPGPKIAAGGNS